MARASYCFWVRFATGMLGKYFCEGRFTLVNASDFLSAMERVMLYYNRAKGYALEKVNLSGIELSLLAEAVRNPGATLQSLAEKLSLTLNAASEVVASLVEKGMVSEEGGAKGGKKKVRVSVTKKGRVTKLQASELAWMAFARALGGAASVAIAVAGLINTLSSILDRWRTVPSPEVEEEAPEPKPKTPKTSRKRNAKRKTPGKKKSASRKKAKA